MLLLNVPFLEKDEAKALGAKWSKSRKQWFVPDGVDHGPFLRWKIPNPLLSYSDTNTAPTVYRNSRPFGNGESLMAAYPERYPKEDIHSQHRAERDFIEDFLFSERVWLKVPFNDKEEARKFGARWDPDVKSWWVSANVYESEQDGTFDKWKPSAQWFKRK